MKIMVGCVAVAVLMFLAPGAGSAECWRACVNLTPAGSETEAGQPNYGVCICPDDAYTCPEFIDKWDQAHGCMADEILVDEGGYECEAFTLTGTRWRWGGCNCNHSTCIYYETDEEVEDFSDRCKACP